MLQHIDYKAGKDVGNGMALTSPEQYILWGKLATLAEVFFKKFNIKLDWLDLQYGDLRMLERLTQSIEENNPKLFLS